MNPLIKMVFQVNRTDLNMSFDSVYFWYIVLSFIKIDQED
jgi:hypothetical protein